MSHDTSGASPRILRHRYYDPDVEKVVPKDAVVLDLSQGFAVLTQEGCVEALRRVVRGQWTLESEFTLWLARQIEAQTKPGESA